MINENYQLQLIENIFVRGEYTDIPNYPIAIRYKKYITSLTILYQFKCYQYFKLIKQR